MYRIILFGAVLAGLAGLTACSSAGTTTVKSTSTADWPQYRGPNRDDISPDKGLLQTWPKDGPTVVWKGTGIGIGFSSVAVVGDKVFTMGNRKDGAYIFALDRSSGKNLWQAKVGATSGGGGYPGTRCTPTVDDDLVYGLSARGDLVCVEAATGKEKWRKDLRNKEIGGSVGGWEYSESPLIDGERLVCTPGGNRAAMLVLDKKTGKEIWRAPLKQAAGYSSIVVSNAGNVKQYVQVTNGGTIGVAAKDGKLLWDYTTFAGNTANAPTPVVMGDQIFTTVGYGKGAALLRLDADGDGVKSTEEYHTRAMTNKHGGVLIVGDYVYGDAGDNGNLVCMEWKTGKVKWTRDRKKSKGGGSASVTYADGMLYVHYANGWVSLVKASPDRYVEASSFLVPEGKGERWAHPVVIGGRLYIRQADNLWCYDVKAK